MHKITDQITDSMYLNVFQACNVYNIVHIFAFVLRATCDLLTFQNFKNRNVITVFVKAIKLAGMIPHPLGQNMGNTLV